ncbi:MAG: hypothetical protein EON51_02280 [Acinetobacter sp.]|nr:MAG: hypothetical protein EON51_02280 [Acinetobacter sp.]
MQTILLQGEVTESELKELNTKLVPLGLIVDTKLNKAEIDEIIKIIFSDYSVIGHLRDAVIDSVALKGIELIYQYFKNKREIDKQVSYDYSLSHGTKVFTIYVNTYPEHIVNISNQVALIINNHILEVLPSGSAFYVEVDKDGKISVLVHERNSGKQYYINS